MSDEKISAFADGGVAQATDDFVIARAGANFKLTAANLKAYVEADDAPSAALADCVVDAVGTAPNTYATVSAAYAGGKRAPHVTATTTEPGDLIFNDSVDIYLSKGAYIGIPANNQIRNLGGFVNIVGSGPIASCGITFAFTTPGTKNLFSGSGAITGRNFTLFNTSTVDNSGIADGTATFLVSNLTVITPNQANCGLYLGSSSNLSRLTFAGGGANSTLLLNTNTASYVDQVSFAGTVPTATIIQNGVGSTINKLSFNSGSEVISIENSGTIMDSTGIASNSLTIETQADNTCLWNVACDTGFIEVNGYSNGKLIDVSAGGFDSGTGSPEYWSIRGGEFNGPVTSGDKYFEMVGTRVVGQITINDDFACLDNVRTTLKIIDNGLHTSLSDITDTTTDKIYYRPNWTHIASSSGTIQAEYGQFIVADPNAAAISVDLPSATLAVGDRIAVKTIDGTNSVTLTPAVGEYIDDDPSLVLSMVNQTAVLVADGTNWQIESKYNG